MEGCRGINQEDQEVDNTQDAPLVNLDDEALANTVIQRPADFFLRISGRWRAP